MDLITFAPYNWLKEATIYNKKRNIVPTEWITENVDVIALLFNAKGVDREGVIEQFYSIYENIKYLNLPLEVVYVPFDETLEDFQDSYEDQANWFTFNFADPLILTLKFAYGITCIPHIYVLKTDCTIISTHGIQDLEVYNKNAVITWLSTADSTKSHRKMSKDAAMYGQGWKYLNVGANVKRDYSRRFSATVPTITEDTKEETKQETPRQTPQESEQES